MTTISEAIIRFRIQARLVGVNQAFQKVGRVMNNVKKNVRGVNTVMGMNMDVFRGVNAGGAQFTTIGAKMTNRFRMLTHGARGFKMEMLGVMFFGMMLQKTFTGLLKPAMDLFGIFELWRVTLQVLFLPVMEELFPHFLKLMEYLMELSPTTKKWIGRLTVLAAILGFIIFLVGSVTLGLGSMAIAFGTIPATLIGIVAGFSAIAGVVSIVMAFIVIAATVWITNLGNIREHTKTTWSRMLNLIKDTMGRIWEVIVGVWTLIINILTGKWKEAWDTIKDIGENVKEIMKNIATGIFHFFLDPLILRLNMVLDLIERITGKVMPRLGDVGVASFGSVPEIPELASVTSANARPVAYSPTYNINVSDKEELERIMDEQSKKTMEELSRLTANIAI